MAWQSAARRYTISEYTGFLSWTAAHIVYNVATEMVAMSSSVEKLVDVITAEKAGFLPASMLPAGVFVSFAFIA